MATWANPDVGGKGPDPRPPLSPLKTSKVKGFLAILVRMSYKVTKLASQHSNLGHYRPANETPFKWRFAGGLMVARLQWYLFGYSLTSKNVVKVRPPLTKLSGSARWPQRN